jgi:hypothetical protein
MGVFPDKNVVQAFSLHGVNGQAEKLVLHARQTGSMDCKLLACTARLDKLESLSYKISFSTW